MPIEESIKMEPDDDEDLLNQVTFSEVSCFIYWKIHKYLEEILN